MGLTVAIQTQCCLSKREEAEDDGDDDEPLQQEETAVQLVESVPWRSHGGPLGTPPRSQAAVPRSLSNATTIIPTRG